MQNRSLSSNLGKKRAETIQTQIPFPVKPATAQDNPYILNFEPLFKYYQEETLKQCKQMIEGFAQEQKQIKVNVDAILTSLRMQ